MRNRNPVSQHGGFGDSAFRGRTKSQGSFGAGEVVLGDRLLDVDRLARRRGSALRVVDPADPEVDDCPDAHQLLAASVPEVLARLGRHHAVEHAPPAGAQAGALELVETRFEGSHAVFGGRGGARVVRGEVVESRARPSAAARSLSRARRILVHDFPPRAPALLRASNSILSVWSSIRAARVGASTSTRGRISVRRHPPTWSTSSSAWRVILTSSRLVNGSSSVSRYVPSSRRTWYGRPR